MKSIHNSNKTSEILFPCLMSNSNYVVLFSKSKTGTIVHNFNITSVSNIGYSSQDWNMNEFELVKGEVTLSNN
jgi:hypothetical protein